jgi:hypothetical protein
MSAQVMWALTRIFSAFFQLPSSWVNDTTTPPLNLKMLKSAPKWPKLTSEVQKAITTHEANWCFFLNCANKTIFWYTVMKNQIIEWLDLCLFVLYTLVWNLEIFQAIILCECAFRYRPLAIEPFPFQLSATKT